MLTVDYIDVLNGACDLCGLPRLVSNLTTQDNAKLQAFISKRLAQAARYHFWPDYIRNEERWFRQFFAPVNTYGPGDEVFHTYSGKYFQNLKWAAVPVTSITRSGTKATLTSSMTHSLVTGDVVTVAGANQGDYNITAPVTVTSSTVFTYEVVNSPATPATGTIVYYPNPANRQGTPAYGWWYPCGSSYSGSDFSLTTAYAIGDVAYYPVTGRYYACHTATSGVLPINTSLWGILTVFDRYVGFAQTGYTALGDVLEVWNTNPRAHRSALELDFELSQNGVQIAESATSVWLRYRIRVPRLSGTTYSATATYAAGNQIYYSSATTAGNFYDCLTLTTAGQNPDNTATKWSVVQIPRIFEMYLKWGAYADWLVGDGQNDKAGIEDRRAEGWLAREANIFMQQEQQRRPTRVLSR